MRPHFPQYGKTVSSLCELTVSSALRSTRVTLAAELGLRSHRKLAHSTGLAEEASPVLGGFLGVLCVLL